MECAPGQLADAMLEAMAAAGVNRVSLGVQSFVDAEAHASGRLHDRDDGRSGFAAAACGRDHEPERGFDCGTGRADGGIMGGVARRARGLRRSARQRVHAGSGRGLAAGARNVEARIAIPRRTGARATMRLRGCMSARSSGWGRRGCGNTKFRILRDLDSSRGTICAIGRGGLTWAWGWMRRRWHCTQQPFRSRGGGESADCVARDDDRRSEGVSCRDGNCGDGVA